MKDIQEDKANNEDNKNCKEQQLSKTDKDLKTEKKLEKKDKKIYGRRKETTLKKVERTIVKGIIKTFYKIVFRLKTKNQENIPSDEPIILCANHLNIFDAVGIVLFTKKPIRFIAKYEVFENSFANFLLHLFDAIPIKRGRRDLEAMKISMKTLKDGESLGLFPEGTRRGLAKGAKVQNGAAYMAMKAKVKVVPVGIQGSFKPFTKVVLNYGKPLDFSKYDSKNPEKDNLELATKEIMDNIIMLTKEEK